jgi:hypothetical protein
MDYEITAWWIFYAQAQINAALEQCVNGAMGQWGNGAMK